MRYPYISLESDESRDPKSLLSRFQGDRPRPFPIQLAAIVESVLSTRTIKTHTEDQTHRDKSKTSVIYLVLIAIVRSGIPEKHIWL